MTTNKNDDEIIEEEMKDLLEKLDQTGSDVQNLSRETSKGFDEIENRVDQNVKEIDAGLSDLDKSEKETEEEMEKLVLERAKEVEKEEPEES